MSVFFEADAHKVYRSFYLSQNFLSEFQDKQPNWGPVGYLVYKRTYARPTSESTTEEWWQTCKRVVEGVYNVQKSHCKNYGLPWNDRKAQNSAQEMFRRMWEFKFTPPGRGLWSMGTDTMYKKGSACLNNCGFVSTENLATDFTAPFTFLMDMSMLGVGVGSDTRGAGTIKINPNPIKEGNYVVEDSREGWCDLLRVVLGAFVGSNPLPDTIDYSLVRKEGEPIKGYGGIASGPQPLKNMVADIISVLSKNGSITEHYKISSRDIVDIFNIIGCCVVSGGVRRTAEIMFGNVEDEEFLNLKDYKKYPYRSHFGWTSNNSVFGKVGMDYSPIISSISREGEPGVVWLDTIRNYGRTIDPPNHKDYRVMGCNPCAEQSLESFELCCLVETFPERHDSYEDYEKTLKMAYLYAKSVTLIPTHDSRVNSVLLRNRRIGCSMSGIIPAMNKFGRRNFLNMCDKGYKYIQKADQFYSEWLCVPKSIKTTSIKPSGTVSLLCGSTPGIHYPHSEYYIRRITFDKSSPQLDACREAGYLVEPNKSSADKNGNIQSYYVCIPIKETNFKRSKDDVTIWEQFANAADLQKYWADNQVSITVTFSKDEISQIQPCFEYFESSLKSISLLPLLDHTYEQPIYETITEERYYEIFNKMKKLNLNTSTHEVTDEFCDGESCVI